MKRIMLSALVEGVVDKGNFLWKYNVINEKYELEEKLRAKLILSANAIVPDGRYAMHFIPIPNSINYLIEIYTDNKENYLALKSLVISQINWAFIDLIYHCSYDYFLEKNFENRNLHLNEVGQNSF